MPENCPHLLRCLYLGLHRTVSQFGTDKLNPDKNDERCCRERREQRKVTSLLHRMLSQKETGRKACFIKQSRAIVLCCPIGQIRPLWPPRLSMKVSAFRTRLTLKPYLTRML